MPIVSAQPRHHPLIDGRQSDRAMQVRRGVQRLFEESGIVTLPEFTLANGRRADLCAITREGAVLIIEIKSSIEDMRVDTKWPDYRDFCDQLYFATLPDVPPSIFPDDCGFVVADMHGAEIVRDAPKHPLNAARRKAVTLKYAR
ncbi:MAG: MmcB family DNA repair protein, partial [Pseudomonadota bacterium]